jgi:hypothetical protein
LISISPALGTGTGSSAGKREPPTASKGPVFFKTIAFNTHHLQLLVSYSGAVPNEKISWGKLGLDTPKFIIESDATIVAPLIFAYLLGW